MSKTAFVPYAPLDVVKPLAENIWIVDGPEIRMAYLGLKLPFPTRMTVIRLPRGGIWLHSPTEPTDEAVAAVRSLGPVKYLIAPNSIHYWWIPDWKRRFPESEVHAVAGLERTAKRSLPENKALDASCPASWAGVIDQVIVPGDLFTEAAFFHVPSRTLILTDLIENFEPERARNRVLRWVLRLSGAADPDGKAPFDMQLSFLRHRKALRAAVERMIAWNPERILIAHGRWYERDAVAELRRAFRWVL